MKSLSIIGFGTFGQFIAPYLTPYFNVSVWNRTPQPEAAESLGVTPEPIEICLQKDIIVLCTNIVFFEPFLKQYGKLIQPKALVLDVASIKSKPIGLMKTYVPPSCEIIGTHPLFGPQSGKHGIKGLHMILCPVRTTQHECVVQFLSATLGLQVTTLTAEAHDKQMAYVQGLTHFIGRALHKLDIPNPDQKTKAYQLLLDLKTMLGGDSWDLFTSIENDNPFALKVRNMFQETLLELEKDLKKA